MGESAGRSDRLWRLIDARKDDSRVLSAVKRHLELETDRGGREAKMLHGSEMSRSEWCPRHDYYRIVDGEYPPEDIAFGLRNVFDEGHDIHHRWQRRLWDLGVLRGTYECIACRTSALGEPEVAPFEFEATSPDRCVYCGSSREFLRYREVPIRDDDLMIIGHADGDIDDGEEPALLEVKGLPLDTLLPTPSGWTTMGAVRVGDFLLGSDGRPCQVTRKSDVKQIGTYTVKFDDGTEQVCDREHFWWTLSGRSSVRERVIGIEEIAQTLVLGGQKQHRVPLSEPIDLKPSDFPVDPYALGCWLGDGSVGAGSARVSKNRELYVEMSAICAVGEYWESGNYWTVHGLITHLKAMGLAGVRSSDRWIPGEYLRGSLDQRLALLQGLMDTDGTVVQQRKQVSFTTTSERLALNVRELVASLGWRPYLIEVERSGFGKTVRSWDVRWSPFLPLVPFRRPSQVKKIVRGRRPTRHRVVVDVVPGPDVATACVAVDSPNRTYLCGTAFLPTHNSVGQGTVRYDAPELITAHTRRVYDADGKESTYTDWEALWRSLKRPMAPHLIQTNLYMHLKGYKLTIFIYECKWNQQVKEFRIRYSPRLIEDLLDGARDVKHALEVGRPPVRPGWATKKDKTCKACPYFGKCWGQGDNGDDTKTSRAQQEPEDRESASGGSGPAHPGRGRARASTSAQGRDTTAEAPVRPRGSGRRVPDRALRDPDPLGGLFGGPTDPGRDRRRRGDARP